VLQGNRLINGLVGVTEDLWGICLPGHQLGGGWEGGSSLLWFLFTFFHMFSVKVSDCFVSGC